MICKKIASVILAGAIVLCATACGTGAAEGTPADEGAAKQEQGQASEEKEEKKRRGRHPGKSRRSWYPICLP